MQQLPPNAQGMTLIIPLAVIALVIFRSARTRRLRVERLWISPLLVALMIGLALAQEGAPTPVGLAIEIGGVALGAAIGWWRSSFTHIEIDQETHELTRRASPIGLVIILGVFLV